MLQKWGMQGVVSCRTETCPNAVSKMQQMQKAQSSVCTSLSIGILAVCGETSKVILCYDGAGCNENLDVTTKQAGTGFDALKSH